jgi:hypothetical protein
MTIFYQQDTTAASVEQHAQSIEHLALQFDGLGLNEILDAALQDRVDTKFIIGLDQLSNVLPHVIDHYAALTINDRRLLAYQTLYFDTRDFTFYSQHHNGLASRYKVRARKYIDTNTAFFEVKHRTNRERTLKSRLAIPDLVTDLDDQLIDFTFAHTHGEAEPLEPKLWNDYMRMTLVNKSCPERVTLDFDMRYLWNAESIVLPGIVIVEVKQAQQSRTTEFVRQIRGLGIHPLSYSKYAAGVYSLYRDVKINNFKPQIRRVNKIMQRTLNHE